jgi:hypothetical protein
MPVPATIQPPREQDWAPLYDLGALRDCAVPVAALVAYEDLYVERRFRYRNFPAGSAH